MLAVVSVSAQEGPKTEITKWPDGKLAAAAITYDDSTINQFRVALPLMNERGLVGTFFVITAQIPGSKNMPTFVGRPIMDILKESATVPTSAANVYERTSVLRYLGEIQRNEIVLATRVQPNNFVVVDAVLAKLRESGQTYAVDAIPYTPVRSEEAGRPAAAGPGGLSWDEMRKVASQGHEIANHAVSHARLPSLDEANILYEVDKAKEELSREMGAKHLFSIEAPYGIDDERVRKVLINRFPLTRNWVSGPCQPCVENHATLSMTGSHRIAYSPSSQGAETCAMTVIAWLGRTLTGRLVRTPSCKNGFPSRSNRW